LAEFLTIIHLIEVGVYKFPKTLLYLQRDDTRSVVDLKMAKIGIYGKKESRYIHGHQDGL
jgi:hypothetical protein